MARRPKKPKPRVSKLAPVWQENSRPQLAAKAQALTDLSFNQSQVAEHLGISRHTVAKLIREDLPEDWRLYREAVKRYFFETDTGLADLTGQKLREKLEAGEGRVSELAFLYRTLRELQDERRNPTTAVQINNNLSGLSEEQLGAIIAKGEALKTTETIDKQQ